jgi:hypothetical protein
MITLQGNEDYYSFLDMMKCLLMSLFFLQEEKLKQQLDYDEIHRELE